MSAIIIAFPKERAAAPAHSDLPCVPGRHTHRCHADDCKAEIPLHQPFCDCHALLLTPALRRRLWRSYRPRFYAGANFIEIISVIERACAAIRRVEFREAPAKQSA
jgi:hypothetical protein